MQNNSTLVASLSTTTQNLGFCKGMTKPELLQRLHETLREKDRLNEKMSQAIREKLDSENSMNQLTFQFGNLQEAYNHMRHDHQRTNCLQLYPEH